jgi:hypothetical protein
MLLLSAKRQRDLFRSFSRNSGQVLDSTPVLSVKPPPFAPFRAFSDGP